MKRKFGYTMLMVAILFCSATVHAKMVNNGISKDEKTIYGYDDESIRIVRPGVIRYQSAQVYLEDDGDHVRQLISDIEVDCSDMSYKILNNKAIMYSGKTVVQKSKKVTRYFSPGTIGFSAAARVCSKVMQ